MKSVEHRLCELIQRVNCIEVEARAPTTTRVEWDATPEIWSGHECIGVRSGRPPNLCGPCHAEGPTNRSHGFCPWHVNDLPTVRSWRGIGKNLTLISQCFSYCWVSAVLGFVRVGPQLSYESVDECLRINRTQHSVKRSNGEDPGFRVTLLMSMEEFSEMLELIGRLMEMY